MTTSRRTFLKAASLLGAVSPVGVQLWSSTANAAVTDYKALVCLFLYGANDNANTVIPFSAPEHQAYLSQRGGDVASGGVGIPLNRLGPTQLGTRPFALNPGLKRVAGLFDTSAAAVLANVGPLIEPTALDANGNLVKKLDHSKLAALPPKLRSHNDQQAFWQSFSAEGGSTGWGGRMGDAFISDGSNPLASSVFTAVSAAGSAVFLSGARTIGYQVSPGGPLAFDALEGTDKLFGLASTQAQVTVKSLVTNAGSPRMFERDLNALRKRSIDANTILSAKLTQVGDTAPVTAFQSYLGSQLRMVLRLIRAGKALGLKRQVFHVALGGFDMHDGLVGYDSGGEPLPDTQEALLADVDAAIADFYEQSETADLNRNQVTLFTASDFGRTYNPNTDGSDHGWGSHHFIVGGAVKGGKIYGTMPLAHTSDPAWMQRGVLMPTTSTQQMAYTLGSWLDVPTAALVRALPGIENFGSVDDPQNLGFMR